MSVHLILAYHHFLGEDYNLATALRQGVGQQIFSWIFYLPLACFFSPSCFIAHNGLNTLYQFWIHTELIGHLGPLEYILNTASHHRMHHRPPGNCNYAGVFIIWDRMFGTFVGEDSKQNYYGLAKQHDTFDPLWANVEHLNRVVRSQGIGGLFMRRWKHKKVFSIKALFNPIRPEHGDGMMELWKLPAVESKREKLEGVTLTASLYLYIGFMWLYTLFTFFTMGPLEYSRDQMTMLTVWALISLSCQGRLCTNFSTSWKLESLRQVMIVSLRLWQGEAFQTPNKSITFILDYCLIAHAIMWISVMATTSFDLPDKTNAGTNFKAQ